MPGHTVLDPNNLAMVMGLDPTMQEIIANQPQQPVNPFSSIFDKKDANIQAQQDLLKQYQDLSQQRTRSAFVNPDAGQKGFLDALKDPTEAQRNAFIAFGLGLASSTGDISQRLGTALGQGVGALQKTRAQDRARELQALQFQGQQLGLERQNLQAQLDQQKLLMQAGKITNTNSLVDGKPVFQDGFGRLVGADRVPLTQEQLSRVESSETFELNRESTKAIVDDVKELRKNVLRTEAMLAEAQRGENALANAETGFFAEGKLAAKKFLNLFGITGFKDDISATQALQQVLGQNVLDIMRSGALGAGTGLSDKDREYAEKVAGGTIALTEENIRYAIDAKRRAANYFRQQYNDSLENYKNTFEEAGKPAPVFLRARFKDKFDLIDFTPISVEGRALFGTEPGTLQELRNQEGSIFFEGPLTPDVLKQKSKAELFNMLGQ